MKNSTGLFYVTAFVASMALINACKEKAEIPSLTTTPVSAITSTSATSGGNVISDGGSEITARGIFWSTSQNPDLNDNKTTDGTGPGTFVSILNGLTANTTYYVRAYATNSEGTSYGSEISFLSDQARGATLTTSAVSSVSVTTAVSGGNISDEGDAVVTERGVCWSTSQNPVITGNKTSDGAGQGSFTSNLSGLSENTTYYVRAYAVTSVGTSYGNEVFFKTSSVRQATLTTADVLSVTSNTAVSGGNISSDGGGLITARGICWSTNQNPTLADSFSENGTGPGDFTSSLAGLAPGTTYYVRAYATNSAGTAYGPQKDFTTDQEVSAIVFNPSLTYGSVTDIEGNTYKTIRIGPRIWMAENLKTTRYNDNEAIPLVTENSTWSNLTSHGYSWYNNSSAAYKDAYGALYNWYAVSSGKLCPAGWHVFTQNELNDLKTLLGNGTDIGAKLKETGNTHWALPNPLTTNESGWTGLPGGRRNEDGEFTSIGFVGYWWSATEFSSTAAVDAMLYWDFTFLDSNNFKKTNGMSVRCVKD